MRPSHRPPDGPADKNAPDVLPWSDEIHPPIHPHHPRHPAGTTPAGPPARPGPRPAGPGWMRHPAAEQRCRPVLIPDRKRPRSQRHQRQGHSRHHGRRIGNLHHVRTGQPRRRQPGTGLPPRPERRPGRQPAGSHTPGFRRRPAQCVRPRRQDTAGRHTGTGPAALRRHQHRHARRGHRSRRGPGPLPAGQPARTGPDPAADVSDPGGRNSAAGPGSGRRLQHLPVAGRPDRRRPAGPAGHRSGHRGPRHWPVPACGRGWTPPCPRPAGPWTPCCSPTAALPRPNRP